MLLHIFRHDTDIWSGDNTDVHSHVVKEASSSLLPTAFFGTASGIYKVPVIFVVQDTIFFLLPMLKMTDLPFLLFAKSLTTLQILT